MSDFNYCTIELGPQADRLSGQQKATVLLLSLGMTNKEIAEVVHRSPETVAKYVDALRIAFGVSTRAAIVGQAFCHGVLAPAARTACALIFSVFISHSFSPAESGSGVAPAGGGTAMSTINRITYASTGKPVKGATRVKPASRLHSFELAALNAKNNTQRLVDYITKRDNQERAA
jgi:DNA-binding CsgD family transcriptional regulator